MRSFLEAISTPQAVIREAECGSKALKRGASRLMIIERVVRGSILTRVYLGRRAMLASMIMFTKAVSVALVTKSRYRVVGLFERSLDLLICMHFLRGIFGTGSFPSLVKLDSLSIPTLSFIYPGLESIQSLIIYHDQLPVSRVMNWKFSGLDKPAGQMLRKIFWYLVMK